jgi:hypothetical protein
MMVVRKVADCVMRWLDCASRSGSSSALRFARQGAPDFAGDSRKGSAAILGRVGQHRTSGWAAFRLEPHHCRESPNPLAARARRAFDRASLNGKDVIGLSVNGQQITA